MGDERGRHGHQRAVFKYRQVAPLKIVDRGVFHGNVVVPVLQRAGKTVVPGTAPDGPDGREGLGGYHIESFVARERTPAGLRSSPLNDTRSLQLERGGRFQARFAA